MNCVDCYLHSGMGTEEKAEWVMDGRSVCRTHLHDRLLLLGPGVQEALDQIERGETWSATDGAGSEWVGDENGRPHLKEADDG